MSNAHELLFVETTETVPALLPLVSGASRLGGFSGWTGARRTGAALTAVR
jgi:hypothetical protein